MKVLIISANRHRLPVPVFPLGACMVADSASRSGHKVELLDLMFERDPRHSVAEAAARRPDIIGLSVRNIDNNHMQHPLFFIPEAARLVELIRGISKAPIVLGGASAAVMPEELLRFTGADIAVTGDGETAFPRLLDRYAAGEAPWGVPCTARIREGKFEAIPREPERNLPDPGTDFARWVDIGRYLSSSAMLPVQTKLGCHFKCIYCTYRKIEGAEYVFFDREKVVGHINKTVSSGTRDIEFVDNIFNFPYERASRLCEDIAETGMPARLYTMEMNPLFIDDPLLKLMRRAGFRGLGITAESASDRVLESLQKGYGAEDVARAAGAAGRSGIPCLWIFLLGGPGETETSVGETLRFAEKFISPKATVFFNIGLRVYPGTGLELLARRQGLVSTSRGEMLSPVFYLSPELKREWLVKKVKSAMDRHANFIDSDSIGLSYLPLIQRIAHKMGVRAPLWRYTPWIRRCLNFFGAGV